MLVPKYPFLILGNNEFAYPKEPCVSITEDQQICNHVEWQPLQPSTDCMAQVITQQKDPVNCLRVTASFNDTLIQQIKQNTWIVVFRKETVAKTKCNGETQYQRLKGVNLITINDQCVIRIGDHTLKSHERYIKIKETIPLPKLQLPNPSDTIIELRNIDLDNINTLLNKAKVLDTNTILEKQRIIGSKPSWSTILLYIILLIAVIGYIVNRAVQRFWKQKQFTPREEIPLQEAHEIRVDAADAPQPQPPVRLILRAEELRNRN
ncbi:uncharacterized protein LOC123721950 [Papilio machaon]|uniref:uncharacterized protein LOC123721950 n=1 Tax=Papilio machaon TaxID=76193 RepID=UPI001E662F29|nr:uncharacterized protein LOC123721950 [Papilio machaon]